MTVFRHLFHFRHLVTNKLWKAISVRGSLAIFHCNSDLQAALLTLKIFFPQETLTGWWIFEFWRFHSRYVIAKQGTRTTLKSTNTDKANNSIMDEKPCKVYRILSNFSSPLLYFDLSQGIKKMDFFFTDACLLIQLEPQTWGMW